MGPRNRDRRAAAAREIEAREKADAAWAEWVASTNEKAAADPTSVVRSAAFAQLKLANSTSESAAALHSAFPSLDDAARTKAAEDAYALHRAAEAVAELVRQHKLTRNDALQRLARECPNFPVASYVAALGGGMFYTR